MTTENAYRAQGVLTYTFNDITFLQQALTAAGADMENYDGCRKLAQLGDSFIETVLIDNAHFTENSRSNTSQMLQAVATRENRALTAKRLGIENCISYNPRQKNNQEAPTKVLSNTISAIVGAVWFDSGRDFEALRSAVMDFGYTIQETPDMPLDASLQEQSPPANDVGSSLPSTDWSNVPSSTTLSQWSEDGLDFTEENIQNSLSASLSDTRFHEIQVAPEMPIEFLDLEEALLRTLSSADIHTTDLEFTGNLEYDLFNLEIAGDTQFRQIVTYEAESPDDALTETISRKRKLPDEEKSRNIGDSATFDLYIVLEKKRCDAFGLSCPEQLFDLAMKSTLSFKQKKAENLVAKTFFFGIGSSESIVVLQDIVEAHLCNRIAALVKTHCFLSKADRLKEIGRLSGAASYVNFLKRCHILQLFRDCSVSNRKSSDGFVIDTAQSIAEQSGKKMGNPSNLGDAEVSKSIMVEVYPDLKEGTAHYKREYRSVSALRKLGQRLDQLASKFGYGILGLLPATSSSNEFSLCISDQMILYLKNGLFTELVRILDNSQGHLLRQYSQAVENVVKGIFQGTLSSTSSVAINRLERELILNHPKGSPVLLQLLSKTT